MTAPKNIKVDPFYWKELQGLDLPAELKSAQARCNYVISQGIVAVRINQAKAKWTEENNGQ